MYYLSFAPRDSCYAVQHAEAPKRPIYLLCRDVWRLICYFCWHAAIFNFRTINMKSELERYPGDHIPRLLQNLRDCGFEMLFPV